MRATVTVNREALIEFLVYLDSMASILGMTGDNELSTELRDHAWRFAGHVRDAATDVNSNFIGEGSEVYIRASAVVREWAQGVASRVSEFYSEDVPGALEPCASNA